MKNLIRLTLPVLCSCGLVSPSRAMVINITYDSSVTNLANPALVQPAVAAAVQLFQAQFTNAITVNITVAFDPNVGLGMSDFNLAGVSYSTLKNALTARRVSASDFSSVASLPATDPTGSGSMWYIPRAQVKALGISGLGISANDNQPDGTISFSPPSSTTYTFNPANRAVAGAYDFIGVVEHEISEVLGRVYGLNYGIPGYTPFDLLRFTSSGVRSFDINAANVFFSVDNGATAVKAFNSNINEDLQDWASSAPPDAFDAAVPPGYQLRYSSADQLAMDVLGYNLRPVTSSMVQGSKTPNGAFSLSFTNWPYATFSVLASSNLTLAVSNWTVLGTATENPTGQYHFTDSAASGGSRYYRVRFP